MLREIERILEWPRMLKATVISKGFSFDEKYKIELESGPRILLKYAIHHILNGSRKNMNICSS